VSYAPSAAVLEKIERAIAAYPERSAALLPVLHLIQGELGHVPPEAEVWAAAKLGLQPVRVREVLTFYTMFRRQPAGRTVIRVCRNLSCTLAGADEIVAALRRELGLGPGDGDTTADGAVTLVEVECLGHCDHAPCLQVDGVDHGPMTAETAAALVKGIRGR
jgi:NADH:ubiquinone oxidoreductase subunit E